MDDSSFDRHGDITSEIEDGNEPLGEPNSSFNIDFGDIFNSFEILSHQDDGFGVDSGGWGVSNFLTDQEGVSEDGTRDSTGEWGDTRFGSDRAHFPNKFEILSHQHD